jgi:hypothetical protein
MSEHDAEKPARSPVDFDELFPGRFLKAGLFREKPLSLRIKAVRVEELPDDQTGGTRRRGVLAFEKTDLELVLNRTNGECIKAMFGPRVNEWVGKRVTFACEQDRFGPDLVDAIRVIGSPDIEKTVDAVIKMPKKRPKTRRLLRTVVGAGPGNLPVDGTEEKAPKPIDDKDVPF